MVMQASIGFCWIRCVVCVRQNDFADLCASTQIVDGTKEAQKPKAESARFAGTRTRIYFARTDNGHFRTTPTVQKSVLDTRNKPTPVFSFFPVIGYAFEKVSIASKRMRG